MRSVLWRMSLFLQTALHVLWNGYCLQRAGVALFLSPDARLGAFRGDLAGRTEEDVADDEGAAAELLDMAFHRELIAMLRGAPERALGGDQRRAFLPLSAAHIVAPQPGGEEQPVGRLVEPAEIGRVVDDAGRIAIAPFDHDLVTAPQRHGATITKLAPDATIPFFAVPDARSARLGQELAE